MRQDGSLNDAMLIVNPLTRLAQVVLLVFTIFTVLLSVDATFTKHVGEYLGIILFATSAMMVLVSTQNLLVIFASLELLSLSLYILTGFNKRSRQSAEAALKYFLFGGAAAAFLLFGISLLYGLSGSIELPKIAASVATRAMSPLSAVAIVMVVTGLGFKVAAAPFHLWAPDAYQGAPSPSAALIASGSKVAGFFVLVAMMGLGLSAAGHAPQWTPLIAVVAALSMIVGNLAAIVQSSVRRLLAYSAIGHAGYMLLGVLSNNGPGLRALLFYVITYALAALGAFGVLAALERERVDRLESFAGLSRRAPWISFCMLIFLLSLAGIPPLAGFFGKFYVFSSALGSGGRTMLVLVILAISMSAVSLYYYLKVLKQIYVRNEVETAAPIQTTFMMRVVVGVMALGVIWLGCIPGLLLHWISGALRAVGH
jgi:NADH-quinone oxidoreductase subunit N